LGITINYGNPEGLFHLEKAYQLNPRQPGLLNKLGTAYIKFNRHQEAAVWLRAALKKDSSDIVAKYFLSIADGRKPEKELREQYIEAIFDKFSESFEGLLERLGYKIPLIAREFIETIHGRNFKFKNMVDLGCGTGLGGMAFRDCAEQVTGIDISKSMLEKASLKNIYDTLLQGEVLGTLERSDTVWDLFLATDILVYFQELDPLFLAVRKRSAPGALFVFSTESSEIENFVIRVSGRTAHSSGYIHNLAELYNFTPVMEKRLFIRKEHEKWVEGDLFIYKLP
jgi:predicted TPR repeat methyltransferase